LIYIYIYYTRDSLLATLTFVLVISFSSVEIRDGSPWCQALTL
jgi:hypothetical protein